MKSTHFGKYDHLRYETNLYILISQILVRVSNCNCLDNLLFKRLEINSSFWMSIRFYQIDIYLVIKYFCYFRKKDNLILSHWSIRRNG